MTSWIAISRKDHLHKRWQPSKGFEFVADQQIVPILLAEIARIAPHHVTGFVQAEDGSYQYIALVGVGGDRNLYVSNDHLWLGDYIPASLRAYPFAVLNDTEGNKVFCVDQSHLTDDESFPRLFQDDGTLEKTPADTVNFITQCEDNRQQTLKACAALDEAGLIDPWMIEIPRGEDQPPLTINGVHRVNESKLNELDAQQLIALRNVGALPLAYAQLFSTAQMDQLIKRANFHSNADPKKAPAELDGLFGEGDGGTLNFDSL
ncbi:SapC family protein [Pseudohongiella sp. O18]|uniref:SapC family protein n=1 Tax=Pseudohongiella sp. O18 TaxID=2904248 RepID=UPI001F48019D|nr:SapC family protein [Pseudohongiella sp. O18]